MHLRLGFDIRFELPFPVALVAMLHVHPSCDSRLLLPDTLRTDPGIEVKEYIDSFGNRCSRLYAPAGSLRLFNTTEITCSDDSDLSQVDAPEVPVQELPNEVLQFLLNSRYCEVDRLSAVALDLFGGMKPGWSRVQAVVAYVHRIVQFGYGFARSTKTALDVYTERTGVCRDFQHLAITLCRALNIPARYATGYLGDFGVPPSASPMDFSAWFEVYLGDRWYTCDARHNRPRLGRVLMATGRDASDVALTTSFGTANLRHFTVVSDWLDEPGRETGAGA
ncbi:transglutaminase family protein [Acidipila sp. EB88]|uniref:transglutaminase-like domain-containing protein n=1 Tax=Acidipila sp. EB88 TaxID=2305226 RepID=UPI000F5E00A5|nr:transglutaminase family protein [Acidipila sp. EB88]RRA47184.1 transglutaminase family protein [Acidipila sp. EB88]